MEKQRPVHHLGSELRTESDREQAGSTRWHQRSVTTKAFATASEISGCGVIAKEEIAKGEVVLVYGGIIVPKGEIMDYTNTVSELGIQVNDGFFICPTSKEDSKIGALNHSCDPNCGFKDNITVVAMRDIKPGEELTVDYAMMESHRFTFDCACGSHFCRKKLTPDDWKISDLQKRYKDYFSPYLQEKIESMK